MSQVILWEMQFLLKALESSNAFGFGRYCVLDILQFAFVWITLRGK